MESLAPYRGYITMTIVFVIVLTGTVVILRRPEPVPLSISTPIPRATSTPGVVVIQVCGAVARPGVYNLPDGSRVQDALKRAGDPLSNADVSSLNLARKLNDGEQICVPSTSETPAVLSSTPSFPTPKPSSSCIAYKDAGSHMGETTCVRGSVSSVTQSATTFSIYFDSALDSFYAVSFNRTWDNLRGRCIEVSGKIVHFRGRPEIILDNESQLSFCK